MLAKLAQLSSLSDAVCLSLQQPSIVHDFPSLSER